MKGKNLVFVGMPAFYTIKSTDGSLCIVMERPVQLIVWINRGLQPLETLDVTYCCKAWMAEHKTEEYMDKNTAETPNSHAGVLYSLNPFTIQSS